MASSGDIVMTKTTQLKKLLQIHDNTVQQMNLLDMYVDSVKQRAVSHVLKGDKIKALHLLYRKSVAEAMKHMYRQYRLQKWCQVQELVSNILQNLRPGQVTPAATIPDNDPGYEGEQMQNFVQATMVAYCNYNRAS